MPPLPYENELRTLASHVWDEEVRWSEMRAWAENFSGCIFSAEMEKQYALLALSRFMYFSKRLVREMLKSLYRDHFRPTVIQRIRRNHKDTKDISFLNKVFDLELNSTRFLGVGNPSESGAHLLYYFRQVNYLPKNLFSDIAAAFAPQVDRTPGSKGFTFVPRDSSVTRYVFFDDMVGSGEQASRYLGSYLGNIKKSNPAIDIKYMCLFSTAAGLKKLNQPHLFDGNATCLFELDDTYKCLAPNSRYFLGAPAWFDINKFKDIIDKYAEKMPEHEAYGYGGCQLMLGFSHNTPDNTLPLFWYSGREEPWNPAFLRYDKQYG
ncbi:hypothetical protein VA599_16650 [Chromobacterium sp. TRC.1.1.SA]|uniref:PRTase-CE domain-containing protein n=1 Tax=Chromobacterium indicum TaxID=3110228 RepID=A0ABV0CQL2_9NEIS